MPGYLDCIRQSQCLKIDIEEDSEFLTESIYTAQNN